MSRITVASLSARVEELEEALLQVSGATTELARMVRGILEREHAALVVTEPTEPTEPTEVPKPTVTKVVATRVERKAKVNKPKSRAKADQPGLAVKEWNRSVAALAKAHGKGTYGTVMAHWAIVIAARATGASPREALTRVLESV